jgi:large subunit ribosomal protein L4
VSRKSILVVPSKDDNVMLSARNLQGARVVVASELSTYDIMNANGVLIVKEAIAPHWRTPSPSKP